MLRHLWKPELTWEELTLITERLNATLRGIRKERNILPPMFKCPCCGEREHSIAQLISVNASILAAGRFGICTETEAKEHSKRWAKHRKSLNLDLYGRKAETTEGEAE